MKYAIKMPNGQFFGAHNGDAATTYETQDGALLALRTLNDVANALGFSRTRLHNTYHRECEVVELGVSTPPLRTDEEIIAALVGVGKGRAK